MKIASPPELFSLLFFCPPKLTIRLLSFSLLCRIDLDVSLPYFWDAQLLFAGFLPLPSPTLGLILYIRLKRQNDNNYIFSHRAYHSHHGLSNKSSKTSNILLFSLRCKRLL